MEDRIPMFFPHLPGVDHYAAATQAAVNNARRDNRAAEPALVARFREADQVGARHSALVKTHEDRAVELLRENVTDYLIHGHEFRPLDAPPAEPVVQPADNAEVEPEVLRAQHTRREAVRREHVGERFSRLINYRRDLQAIANRYAAEAPHNEAILHDDDHATPYQVHKNVTVRGIRRAIGVLEHELRRHESLLSTMAADVMRDTARGNRGLSGPEQTLLNTHDRLQAVLGEAARAGSGKASIYAYTGGVAHDGAGVRPQPSAPPLPADLAAALPAQDPAHAGTVTANAPPPARRTNGAFAPTLPGAAKYPWLMPTLIIGGGVTLLALAITAIALSVQASKAKKALKANAVRGAAQTPAAAVPQPGAAALNQAPGYGAPANPNAAALPYAQPYGAVPAYANGMQYGGLPPFGGYGVAGPAAYGAGGPGGYGFGASRYGMVQPVYGSVPPIYG